jgi:hypothetical protein
MNINENHNLLSTKGAADYLAISVGTLNNWRCHKTVKIPYLKFGKSVRYEQVTLDEFILSNKHT